MILKLGILMASGTHIAIDDLKLNFDLRSERCSLPSCATREKENAKIKLL